MTLRLGIPLACTIVAGTGMWYTLGGRVSSLEKDVIDGGRYSLNDHITYAEEQERINAAQDKALEQNRADREKAFEQVNNKLDTMQALLYQIIRDK